MFHADYAHTGKGQVKYKDQSGNIKTKKAPSCVNRFRYITRTAQYENHKDHAETVEYVKSGNMPSFCTNRPDQFWEAAELYERKNGRTSTSLVIALPKELSEKQRVELTEKIIQHLCEKYNFPYTAAIHNHKSAIAGQDQPHLHLMYSERSVDEHDRTAQQFFSRYNAKSPENGGARKVTADFKGEGKEIVNQIRAEIEVLTNESLEQHAPTKIVMIKGIEVEVPNIVSCLHHSDYNRIHGTNLKAVPMMTKEMLRLDPSLTFDDVETNNVHQAKLAERDAMIQKIQENREHNNFELYEPYYNLALQKMNEAKKQKQKDIEHVSASELAYKLDLITYQSTADKVKQIRQLSELQEGPNINYIEAIESKASLLNDVLIKENRKEVSSLVCEIYKHDLEAIQEHSSGRSLTYDEKRISERLNERISQFEHMYASRTHEQFKSENTRNYDDLNNTPEP